MILGDRAMKSPCVLAIGAICFAVLAVVVVTSAGAADDEQALLEVDRAAFKEGNVVSTAIGNLLDSNFTWTDASGVVRTKSQVMQDLKSRKELGTETEHGSGESASPSSSVTAHVYGEIGIVRENSGRTYTLRIWVKKPSDWQALLYQAVEIGAPPTFIGRAPLRGSGQASGARIREAGNGDCRNPCESVPFEPRTADEREVIHSYQAVERAVTAHNSSEWGAHIAEEFFAVTSNSDHPLDKATRIAGLDNQEVAGIAPFPLISARMFEFGDAMVMVSRQQPEHGLPLHVTRVWFKRNGMWLEAYSYQTTIQPGTTPQ